MTQKNEITRKFEEIWDDWHDPDRQEKRKIEKMKKKRIEEKKKDTGL